MTVIAIRSEHLFNCIQYKIFVQFCLTGDMVRHYKKKTDRGSYGSENLNLALEAVKNGIP